MDYFKMYLKTIESEKQKFEAYIKSYGYIENLGQSELITFNDKINNCEFLSYAERADLSSRFVDMLNNL